MASANEILRTGKDGHIFTIVPSDTVRPVVTPTMIWSPAAGDITVKNALGELVTFAGATGWLYVPGIQYIMATGTTATGLVGVSDGGVR
jgi:hypothetical protein